MAERHVSQGLRCVARQRELIERLELGRHDTREANRLLRQFQDVLELHIRDRDRLRKELAAPSVGKTDDIYDGKPWTEMEVKDLTDAVGSGDTIEGAASLIGRSGRVDEVRRKADEVGLISWRWRAL